MADIPISQRARLSIVKVAIGISVGLLLQRAAPAQTNDATPTDTSTSQVIRLPEVVVTGRADSLVGVADSASQGATGQAQLEDRPILRSGEILETVPGVIITQHAGGGKANQYFLRGFNLDHGTDFAVFLDDMPLNLPSHAHGEGYSDMNTVIPEFVEKVDYEKGPYYADVGNYGSAGSAHLVFYKVLPEDFVTVEGGMYGYERGVAGFSQKLGEGNLLYGGEVYHDDGPWGHPDDYQKFNGLLTYSQGDGANGFSVTARGYHGKWNSSDQIPESAVPLVGVFGTLNPTDGGNSQRYSLQGEWHGTDGNSETKITTYGFYYDLDLFSDFTYFLTDPALGDQFEQQDKRWVGGLDARHTLFNEWGGREVATIGSTTACTKRSTGCAWTKRIAKTVAPFCPLPRKRIVLQTPKLVFGWKTKFSGRKSSVRLRPCVATWTILMSLVSTIRSTPVVPSMLCPTPS
jgi:hypothetical protein